jgi:hypothetical protein
MNPLRPLIGALPSTAAFDAEARRLGFLDRTDRFGGAVWTGNLHGHPFTLSVHTRSRTRYHGKVRRRVITGYQINLETPCITGGRITIAPAARITRFVRWLNRKGGIHPVVPADPLPGGLVAWSHDPEWAARLFTATVIRDALPDIPRHDGEPLNASLHVQADKIGLLGVGPLEPYTAALEDWTRSLATLATALPAQPPPSRPHAPGWMERRPGCLIALVFGIALFGAILGALLLLGIALLIHRLQ